MPRHIKSFKDSLVTLVYSRLHYAAQFFPYQELVYLPQHYYFSTMYHHRVPTVQPPKYNYRSFPDTTLAPQKMCFSPPQDKCFVVSKLCSSMHCCHKPCGCVVTSPYPEYGSGLDIASLETGKTGRSLLLRGKLHGIHKSTCY